MCDLSFEDPLFYVEYISKFNPSKSTVYIFVGSVKEDVEVILRKFEDPSVKKISSDELKRLKEDLLKDRFKIVIDYLAKLKASKEKRIRFIFSRIMIDDSLNELKRKLFIHCSHQETNRYILPQNMELWVKDRHEKSHIIGYKYNGMIPHIEAPFELTKEYEYDMYEYGAANQTTHSKKRVIEHSDNHTLLYDLFKNIHMENKPIYTIYMSDAYDEYQEILQMKKYEKSDIITKYLKNYFPVGSYDMKDVKSMYILSKDDNTYNDFIVDNLFHYQIDSAKFESCYLNNFVMNVNNLGSADEGIFENMSGGAKNPITIHKERIKSSSSNSTFKKNLFGKLLNQSKSKSKSGSVAVSKSGSVAVSKSGSVVAPVEQIHDFIDLYQIFEYLRTKKIGKRTPFIKYNDFGFANPFVLISKSSVDQNIVQKQILLSQWTNPFVPVKKFNGLQVKRYIKHITPEVPLFSTLYLYKYGRIQLNVAFKSEYKAGFRDVQECIMNCKDFIDDINKHVIDYRISRAVDVNRKIVPPKSDLVEHKGLVLSKNATITYMNYFIEYHGGEKVDFKELYDFAKLFPNFISINPNQEKSIRVNSIEIRYNRVSGFANLDDVMIRIDKLKSSGATDGLIIKVIEKEFGKTEEECKKYMIEYKNKYSKIQSSSTDSTSKLGFIIQITKNNINIRGVRNMRHMYDTYRFITLFMTLFLEREELKKNSTFKRLLFSRDSSKSENISSLFENITSVKQTLTFANLNLNLDHADQALIDTGAIEKTVAFNMEDDGVGGVGEEEMERKMARLMAGNRVLASDDEIGTDVQLTCDDAILELDTCEDFCNDARYFIRRLQRHDPRIFHDKDSKIKGNIKYEKQSQYSKSCQKIRQPVILAYNPDDGISKESNMEVKRDAYTYAIKYGSDPNRPNWYICPEVWCPYCRIPIPIEDVDKSSIRQRKIAKDGGVCKTGVCPHGDHQVFVRGNEDPFPGFAKNKTKDGFCMPCCFGKRQDDPKYGKYITFQKCLGIDVNSGDYDEKDIYVLGKSIPLDRNRFGVLDERLERVLNSSIEKGYLRLQKGYLRRGVKHEDHNSFLSAIANIFSCDQDNVRSVDDMKQYIVDKIDEKLFRSLYGGNLINLFYDPHKNITPLQNYKNYILSKNIDIDHTYLWDLVQRPSIISKEGVNLFIFENDLLCPLGERVKEFYDMSRKTIIFAKHKQYYEPIYYVEGVGKQAKIQCMFENNAPEIAKLFEIAYDGCKSYNRIDWKSVVYNSWTGNRNNNSFQKENIVIDYGFTLQETMDELNSAIGIKSKLHKSFIPKVQYMDKSNKVIGIGLRNGLFIPVAPSKLIIHYPNFDYVIIDDYQHIPTLPLVKTYELYKEITKHTSLPVKPIGLILDLENKYVVGMMTEKNRVVCVEKMDVKKVKNHVKLPNVSGKFYTDIDMYIHDDIVLIDDRIVFMNKRKYEDETYMRIRFELSRYLQDHPNEKMKLIDAIKKEEKSISQKRIHLEGILLPIFSNFITLKKHDIDYNFYEKPNHRIPCGLRSIANKGKNGSNSSSSSSSSQKNELHFDCSEDPHCTEVEGSCKLYVNEYNLLDNTKKNLNMYLPMIIEELIRFTLRRNEILYDHIPSIINREHVVENPQKYYMMSTTEPSQIIQKIESIFLDKEGLYIDKRPLFDTITTQDVVLQENKYTFVNMSKLLNRTENTPEIWSKVLGSQFVLLADQRGNKSIFSILPLLIQEFKHKNNSNMTIENVEQLNLRKIKEMMIQFIENPKHRILIQTIHKKLIASSLISSNIGEKNKSTNHSNNSNKSTSKSMSNHNQEENRDAMIELFGKMNPKLFKHVHDFSSLKQKIYQDDYEGTDLDIAILSHIFKINFVILNKVKRDPLPHTTFYGNEGADYYTDYLMILRNNNLSPYKYQWFQVKNKGLIHKEKDYPEKFIHEVLEKIQSM